MTTTFISASRAGRQTLKTLAALALFLAVLAAMSFRLYEHRGLPGSASRDRWALASFRDAIYYPVIAVRDGVNPYDCVRNGDPQRYMQRYPVGDTLPLYSPLILLVFAPFAWLEFDASCVAFTALNVVLLVMLAYITLRLIGRRASAASVLVLSALLLASQPGRGVFNSGQVAIPLAIAAIGALHWGDRRVWRSSGLLAFLTIKATFAGPLGVLLAARRDWRTTLGGFVAGGAICLAGMLFIFGRSGTLSIDGIARVLMLNQSDFYHDPTVIPAGNKARIDLPAAVDYLTGVPIPDAVATLIAGGVLGLTCLVLWRASRSQMVYGATSTASALAMVAANICMYHSVYDLPLLIVPIAACAACAHTSWNQLSPVWRRTLLMLLIVPFINFFWTDGFRAILDRAGIAWGESAGLALGSLYRFLCAANGLALTAAWLMLLISVGRVRSYKLPTQPQVGRKRAQVEARLPAEIA